jgi:hypothetical protein
MSDITLSTIYIYIYVYTYIYICIYMYIYIYIGRAQSEKSFMTFLTGFKIGGPSRILSGVFEVCFNH